MGFTSTRSSDHVAQALVIDLVRVRHLPDRARELRHFFEIPHAEGVGEFIKLGRRLFAEQDAVAAEELRVAQDRVARVELCDEACVRPGAALGHAGADLAIILVECHDRGYKPFSMFCDWS
jgi:hypothetical protein